MQVRGPWNAELVLQSHEAMHVALPELQGGRWAMLVVITGSAMFGPDVVEAIRNTVQNESATMERVATAWVLGPEVEGATLVPGVLRGLYGESDRFRIFETVEPAEAWLNGKIEAA